MKAYLIGGPANGREIDVLDGNDQIVIPSIVGAPFAAYNGEYRQTVYRKSFKLRNGGYVFEVDEPATPKTGADCAADLRLALRHDPHILNDTIRNAVRGMKLNIS